MSDLSESKQTLNDSVEPLKAEPQKKLQEKRASIVGWVILIFLLIGLVWFGFWWVFYRGFETTDDAYVGGNIVVISSRQDGSVLAYYINDTNLVNAGDLLVQLDPTDYFNNFEQAKAALALAARQVRIDYEDVAQKKSNVQLQEAKYSRALLDMTNRQGLVEDEAISKEDFEHAEAELSVAKASLDLAGSQLDAAKAILGTTALQRHPRILKAKADLRTSYLALQRCNIRSPVTGYVAKRNVQVGQNIKAGTPLLNVIPLNNLWVDANYKETQLANVRIGQPVKLVSDFYGSDIKFDGKVVGLVPGTGSVFALLPAQNATGNWIKIVQRVPVRIALDPEQIKKYPLLLGLSMTSTIDLADTSGAVLSTQAVQEKSETGVFDIDMKPLRILTKSIIRKNLGQD